MDKRRKKRDPNGQKGLLRNLRDSFRNSGNDDVDIYMSIGSRELTVVCSMMKATPTTTTMLTTMRTTRILASESRTEQWWASTQSHDYLSSSSGDLDEHDEDFERLLQTHSFVFFSLKHRCILKM